MTALATPAPPTAAHRPARPHLLRWLIRLHRPALLGWLGLVLVLLLSIPWSIAVVRHLTSEESPGKAGDHADSAVG